MKKYKNKEWLKEKYYNEKKTLKEIANLCNCSVSTIVYNMKIYDLDRRNNIVCNKYHKEKEWLIEKYINEKKTCDKISDLCGCSKSTILKWLDKYNIKTRTINDYNLNNINLTDELLENIEGLLLGDGNLTKRHKNGGVTYRHTDKNKSFIIFLMEHLKKLGLEFIGNKYYKIYHKENKKYSYYMSTKTYNKLNNIYIKWYPNNKKKIPDDFKLTPTKLFWWFIGDGSISYDYRKKNTYSIDISSYQLYINKNLIKQLKNKKIKTTTQNNRNTLHIKAESRKNFLKYILSSNINIPNCYEYKFPKGTVAKLV